MPFRIAHLSDPHLSPAPFPGGADLRLKRFLGWVNWKRGRAGVGDMALLERLVDDLRGQGPDHIAMTGDAVNLAMPSEVARAANWMRSLGDPSDVSFTPGNHDAYVRAAMPLLGSAFAPWTEGGVFPYLRVRGDVALIGLSSGVPTAPLLATGRLGVIQREAFARLLRETGARNLARVVLIHHPPIHSGRYHVLRGLDDVREFTTIVKECGAELVLHGHTHRLLAREIASRETRNVLGFVPVLGAPSASNAAADAAHRAAYWLIDVGREAASWRTKWRVRGPSSDSRTIVEREAPAIQR